MSMSFKPIEQDFCNQEGKEVSVEREDSIGLWVTSLLNSPPTKPGNCPKAEKYYRFSMTF